MPSDSHEIIKIIVTLTSLLIILLLAMSCKECPNEPEQDSGTITIAPACITTQSVYLEISVSDSLNTSNIRIQRDTITILETTLFTGDTLIIDDSLQSGKTYAYRGCILDDEKIVAASEVLTVTTLDTTMHEIAYWDVDTLGTSGEINDVWIVDENNIWVVGQIVVPDPDSSWNGTGKETFNAAHWDGSHWNLSRFERGASLNSIWYFSENNIWASGGVPIHWDGEKWAFYHLWDMGVLDNDDGGATYIWALSPDDIYFAGRNGTIVHYDGSSFKKMESGTDCNLDDIYGLDNNHIWAVGTAIKNNPSVILFYNGKEWSTLHDTRNENLCYSNSFYTENSYFMFLNGGSGRYYFNILNHEFRKYTGAGSWYGYDIDGLAFNDIFATGMGSEVLHYNGSTWHLYQEFKNQFGSYGHFKSVKMTDNLIVICGFYYTGYNGLPIIIRGYR